MFLKIIYYLSAAGWVLGILDLRSLGLVLGSSHARSSWPLILPHNRWIQVNKLSIDHPEHPRGRGIQFVAVNSPNQLIAPWKPLADKILRDCATPDPFSILPEIQRLLSSSFVVSVDFMEYRLNGGDLVRSLTDRPTRIVAQLPVTDSQVLQITVTQEWHLVGKPIELKLFIEGGAPFQIAGDFFEKILTEVLRVPISPTKLRYVQEILSKGGSHLVRLVLFDASAKASHELNDFIEMIDTLMKTRYQIWDEQDRSWAHFEVSRGPRLSVWGKIWDETRNRADLTIVLGSTRRANSLAVLSKQDMDRMKLKESQLQQAFDLIIQDLAEIRPIQLVDGELRRALDELARPGRREIELKVVSLADARRLII